MKKIWRHVEIGTTASPQFSGILLLYNDREILVDVSYGGTFYAYVYADDVGLSLDQFDVQQARQITKHVRCKILSFDCVSHKAKHFWIIQTGLPSKFASW